MTKDNLMYKKPASCFEEALPVGNGSFGAMIYGNTQNEKISLNHDTLWSGTPVEKVMPNAAEAFKKAGELVLSEKVDEAEELLINNFHASWTQNYLPMGGLFVKRLGGNGETEEYKRLLDMQNGFVSVEFCENQSCFKREYFVSNPDDCFAARFVDEKPQSYEVCFDSPLRHTVSVAENMLVIKGECPSNLRPADRPAEKNCFYDGGSVKFTTLVFFETNGELFLNNNSVVIKNTLETKFYAVTETSFIGYNVLPEKETFDLCKSKAEKVLKRGFNDIKQRHKKDFSQFYNRTSLDLCSQTNGLTTDEILKGESNYPYLVETTFNFAKYLYISASREGSQAMNLQGIWNEDFQPPWCGSYTLDINLQMNYWAANFFNLPEMQKPFLDLVKKITATGANTAKNYYNSLGSVCHSVSDLWGMSVPCGPKAKKSCAWASWNMSFGWLANDVFKIFEYNQNTDFLKEVFPIIRQAAVFYSSNLTKIGGKLVMCPTTSPENNYVLNKNTHGIAPYSAMSQQIITLLFKNAVKACEILNTEKELKEKLEKMLCKVSVFEILKDGRLAEWDGEKQENDINHRHVSHMYGVYPGELFSEENEKEIFDACKKSLDARGDEGTGWSIAWKIALWARFKDAERSFKLFKDQMRYAHCGENCIDDDGFIKTANVSGGTYPNMMCAHPPFQIDGNFGAAAGIAQWFLQCENGVIKILPALPKELSKGTVKGIAAKGNVVVDIEWNKGKCTSCAARSPTSQTVEFEINKKRYSVELEKEDKKIIALT